MPRFSGGIDGDSDVPADGGQHAPDMPVVCKNIAAVVAQDYCADTVGELALMMTENQLQKVMTESGGKATWSGMITSFLGPFRPSGAPESAKLVLGSAESAKARVKATALYDTTLIGAQMEVDGTMNDEILPEYVLCAYSECEDPATQELSRNDVKAVLDEYTHFMIVTHGQQGGDKALRKHHAKQLRARLPKLPDHGKTKGKERSWYKLLTQRKWYKRNYYSRTTVKEVSLRASHASHATHVLTACARTARPGPP